MKTKTIRLTAERYNEINAYRKILEKDSNARLSMDAALDFIFTDYEHAKAGAAMMRARLERSDRQARD